MEDFREEIKNKTKREQILKRAEDVKIPSYFDDEGKDRILGSGMVKRSAVAVEKCNIIRHGQRRAREDTDDNAALDATDQAELMGNHLRENPSMSDSV